MALGQLAHEHAEEEVRTARRRRLRRLRLDPDTIRPETGVRFTDERHLLILGLSTGDWFGRLGGQLRKLDEDGAPRDDLPAASHISSRVQEVAVAGERVWLAASHRLILARGDTLQAEMTFEGSAHRGLLAADDERLAYVSVDRLYVVGPPAREARPLAPPPFVETTPARTELLPDDPD